MLEITDEGALLVRVSRHKNQYDGTICPKPHTYDCGSLDYFRKNYCAKGQKNCFDINLFNKTEPYLIKAIKETDENPFEQQLSLLEKNICPLIFFFTKGKMSFSFYLVGAYVVKSIDIIKVPYNTFELHIAPEKIIRLPLDILENDYLWNHSSNDLKWCRNIYRNSVAPALEIMLTSLKGLNSPEYLNSIQSIEETLSQLTGSSYLETRDDNVITADIKSFGEKTKIIKHSSFKEFEDKNLEKINNFTIEKEKQKFDQDVENILTITENNGYFYSRDLIAFLHNNLLVNPFLILSGISGGGKTSFALFYAKAMDAEIEIIPVRPDWTSPGHFLGIYNPFEGDFVPTAATKFIRKAYDNYKTSKENEVTPKQFILLLDEMNLARVEHYFSDFLSKLQLPDLENRFITLYDEKNGLFDRHLHIPPNLKIIGTVNIDETTFLFSPKVLDRANYIQLNQINIDGMSRVLENRNSELHNFNSIQSAVIPELKALNSKLSEFSQSFGYRTAWEIIKWIDSALAVGLIDSVYDGLDLQIESKILVKLYDRKAGYLFRSLETYFKDRVNPDNPSKLIYELSLQQLENLITKAEWEEFAIGQQ